MYDWKNDFHLKVCGGCTLGYIPTDRCVSNAPCHRNYCSFKTPTGYCSLTHCVKEENERKQIEGYQYGWVCPKCGAVYGPNVSSCLHCTPRVEITCAY